MEFRSLYTKYFSTAITTDVRISSEFENMSYSDKETMLSKVLKSLHSNVQMKKSYSTSSDDYWTNPYSKIDGRRRELVPIIVLVEVERVKFRDNYSGIPPISANESREIKDAKDIIKNLKEINNKDKLLLL